MHGHLSAANVEERRAVGAFGRNLRDPKRAGFSRRRQPEVPASSWIAVESRSLGRVSDRIRPELKRFHGGVSIVVLRPLSHEIEEINYDRGLCLIERGESFAFSSQRAHQLEYRIASLGV